MKPAGLALALCFSCLVAACGGSGPSPAHEAPSIYWGAQIGDQLTGEEAIHDRSAIAAFERIAGRRLSLIHIAAPFANCARARCRFYTFPTTPMEAARRHGAIPVLSWASQSIGQGGDPGVQPDFQLSDVIAGRYDSHIRSFAEIARGWAHPFFLRFNFEMNGSWFPWSEGVNGNKPGEYVAAWRHVHDIFASVGADNATWVWCPYASGRRRLSDLRALYPGDAYVDWTCLDGYNWGTHPAAPGAPGRTAGWRSFDRIFHAPYELVTRRIAPSKPMLIGEVASSERGGSKAAWIRAALSELPARYSRIHGLLWFDVYADGMDWPLETSRSAAAAFARGISAPAYAGNEFANLDTAPIRPPG